jgi:NAD(P)-dependent dehydrogenase (short-subunit alcohol dehydrogenase family)
MSADKKIIVITGSSRGIGAATARLAAKMGYLVCINYVRSRESAARVRDDIVEGGGTCLEVQADVSKEQDVMRLFETVDSELGKVTALVNNVGIVRQKMSLAEMSADRFREVLETNVISHFLCAKEAVRRMAKSKGGKGGAIVNVSSGASRTGSPFEYVDYAASKGAVDVLTKGLSLEVAADGVRVNCVRPGLIFTDIHADAANLRESGDYRAGFRWVEAAMPRKSLQESCGCSATRRPM